MKYSIPKKKYKIARVAIGLLCCMVLGLTGCSVPAQKYTSTGVGMGTIVTQTVYVQGDGMDVTDRVTGLVEEIEKEISWRIESSEISGINASAGSETGYAVSEELKEEFKVTWQVSEDSGGAFDLTIAPVVRLWDIDTWATKDMVSEDFLPETDEIRDKLSLTGYENVMIDENMIFLPEGYMLDMGAVGKGLACDRILELFLEMEKENGVQGAVISLGGNILTYGEKPDGSAWKVGIVDPLNPETYLGTLTLTGTNFVTTSGDYERYVEVDGVRYHHIIDPSTGYPADSGLRSVTILSDNGLIGDALSTACFVLGAEDAMKLAEKYDVEILMVTKEGEIIMSEGMKGLFSSNSH